MLRTLVANDDEPISMAVCTLSPVRIQSLIPALCRISMASGTPSCSLSSSAVAPKIVSECSICSLAFSISSSLSLIDDVAASYILDHWKYSSSVRYRYAMHSVLSPPFANASISREVSSFKRVSWSAASRS